MQGILTKAQLNDQFDSSLYFTGSYMGSKFTIIWSMPKNLLHITCRSCVLSFLCTCMS